MKKNNKIKKSVSMLAFLFMCAVSVILSSCSDELDIQQSYPFKVETMPVPKDIVRGQTVEIRCELKAEALWDSTEVDSGDRTIGQYLGEISDTLVDGGRGIPVKSDGYSLRNTLRAHSGLSILITRVEGEAHDTKLLVANAP